MQVQVEDYFKWIMLLSDVVQCHSYNNRDESTSGRKCSTRVFTLQASAPIKVDYLLLLWT